MARYEYRLVDVFTDQRFSGNPLAVFPHADGIEPATMQHIARELNLSETTFVVATARADCDYRVRIFTPFIEMPMAGHPTIGTAWVLDHGDRVTGDHVTGDRVTFLEGVGPIVVERVAAPTGRSMWRMEQSSPTWGARMADREAAADLLGLAVEDLAQGPIEVISTGAPFLFVPLNDLDALGRARLQLGRARQMAELKETYGVFCFTVRTGDPAVTVRSRMFAPEVGVVEDPATGGASGPLGCYLVRHGIVPPGQPAHILSVQGVEMGRPSWVHIEIDGTPDQITGVRVGGECVAVGGGYVEL